MDLSCFGIRFAYKQSGKRQFEILEGKNMNTILHLQGLTRTVGTTDHTVALASSASNVCPTVLANDEFSQFEWN
jgi:hypothetical protein